MNQDTHCECPGLFGRQYSGVHCPLLAGYRPEAPLLVASAPALPGREEARGVALAGAAPGLPESAALETASPCASPAVAVDCAVAATLCPKALAPFPDDDAWPLERATVETASPCPGPGAAE